MISKVMQLSIRVTHRQDNSWYYPKVHPTVAHYLTVAYIFYAFYVSVGRSCEEAWSKRNGNMKDGEHLLTNNNQFFKVILICDNRLPLSTFSHLSKLKPTRGVITTHKGRLSIRIRLAYLEIVFIQIKLSPFHTILLTCHIKEDKISYSLWVKS